MDRSVVRKIMKGKRRKDLIWRKPTHRYDHTKVKPTIGHPPRSPKKERRDQETECIDNVYGKETLLRIYNAMREHLRPPRGETGDNAIPMKNHIAMKPIVGFSQGGPTQREIKRRVWFALHRQRTQCHLATSLSNRAVNRRENRNCGNSFSRLDLTRSTRGCERVQEASFIQNAAKVEIPIKPKTEKKEHRKIIKENFKLISINIRSLNSESMLEVERAMEKENASICILQETQLPYSTERMLTDIIFLVSSTISISP